MRALSPKTVADLISALGGAPAVARRLGLTRQMVYQWSVWDAIPMKYYRQICEMAEPLAVSPRQSLFRKATAEQRRKAQNGKAAAE
jgi:hypothetical protein